MSGKEWVAMLFAIGGTVLFWGWNLWFALWLGWRYTAWVSYWLTLRRRYSGHDGPGADDGVGGVACSSPTPCNDDGARLRHSRRATSSRLAA